MSLISRNFAILHEREEQEQRQSWRSERGWRAICNDILGHSLTVITIKAELANRLLDVDIERARNELDDLERLSRDALADVRSAVEGFRGISLPVEIARAREALRAAGIEDEVPSSTDMVPTRLRELFAWTIREGVTNGRSTQRCDPLAGSRSTKIVRRVVDDGRGAESTSSETV